MAPTRRPSRWNRFARSASSSSLPWSTRSVLFLPSELNPSILADFRAGRFAAVAVGSTAGLDVLLAALGPPAAPPPNVRWGVLGPETAKAVTARGLPAPSIPAHARLSELLDLLRKETR